VHYRLAKAVLGIVTLVAMPAGIRAYPSPQDSPYKDQGEYDLATAAGNEKDPQKKLDKLKEWEQKYPDSKLASQRTLMQAQGLLGITMAAYGKTDPALIDASQKAGQQIVDNLDKFFSPANKPAQGVTDDQWAGAKHTFELQAHSALGWDAMTKKEDAKAEEEFKKILSISPNEAQISYWLGSVIVRQKNVARYSEAIYDLARALSVTGPTALPAANVKPAEDYLKKLYSGYHGDETGLDQVKEQVKAAALPPPDYHIKSVEEIQKEQFANEEEFGKAHPDIALWRTISKALKGPDGAKYFDQVKDSQIPPDTIGMFKAKIVSVGEKEIVANVDNAGGDATLKFEKAVNQKVLNAGDAFEFKGVVDSFTADPYMLVLKIDDPKESIKGLPDNAFTAGAAKKAPPKKVVPKKK
jgi:tetratricopeptide (TPR) repeat protein